MEVRGLVGLVIWFGWAAWGLMISSGIIHAAGPTLSFDDAIGIVAAGGSPWLFIAVGISQATKPKKGA